MIQEKNLREMMIEYSLKGDITSKKLNDLGFFSGELTRLTKELEILNRERHGHYSVNLSSLFEKSMDFYREGDYVSAYEIMKRCYIDSKEEITYTYYLFMFSILVGEYEVSFECLDKLLVETSELYSKEDINFYLYMVSLVTNVPLRFGDVKFMKYEEMKVIEDDLRFNVFVGNFKSINYQAKIITLEDRVQYFMLDFIRKRQLREKRCLEELVLQKKYEELSEFYDNELSYRKLSYYEKLIYKLIKEYFYMKISKKIPDIKSGENDSLGRSILNNDFKKALMIQEKFCEDKNINKKANIMYSLLVDINQLMEEICDLDKINKDHLDGEILEQINGFDESNAVQNILELLVLGKIDEAYVLICEYLGAKKDYIYLITYLIKIGIYERDNSFSKLMMAIAVMKSGDFVFVISEYILSFYECLAKRKFDCAGVYLDILEITEKRNCNPLPVKNMREILDNAIRESKDKLKRRSYDFVSDSDISYSEDINLVQANGLVVLEYSEDILAKTQRMVNLVRCLERFLISYNGETKIVLKYKSEKLILETDVISSINEANKRYILGEYEEAFEIYKDVLGNTMISSALCARIGDICLRLNKKSIALDYYMTANSLKNIENLGNGDLSGLYMLSADNLESKKVLKD